MSFQHCANNKLLSSPKKLKNNYLDVIPNHDPYLKDYNEQCFE